LPIRNHPPNIGRGLPPDSQNKDWRAAIRDLKGMIAVLFS